jgi:hypothetical protein
MIFLSYLLAEESFEKKGLCSREAAKGTTDAHGFTPIT